MYLCVLKSLPLDLMISLEKVLESVNYWMNMYVPFKSLYQFIFFLTHIIWDCLFSEAYSDPTYATIIPSDLELPPGMWSVKGKAGFGNLNAFRSQAD